MLVIQRERERRRSSSSAFASSSTDTSGLHECEKLARRLLGEASRRHADVVGNDDDSNSNSARRGAALLSLAQAIKTAAATTVSAQARQQLRLKAAEWVGHEHVGLVRLCAQGERQAAMSVEVLARSRVARSAASGAAANARR